MRVLLESLPKDEDGDREIFLFRDVDVTTLSAMSSREDGGELAVEAVLTMNLTSKSLGTGLVEDCCTPTLLMILSIHEEASVFCGGGASL